MTAVISPGTGASEVQGSLQGRYEAVHEQRECRLNSGFHTELLKCVREHSSLLELLQHISKRSGLKEHEFKTVQSWGQKSEMVSLNQKVSVGLLPLFSGRAFCGFQAACLSS